VELEGKGAFSFTGKNFKDVLKFQQFSSWETMMSKTPLWIWAVMLLIVSALDIHSTYLCAVSGRIDIYESNFLVGWAMNKFGLIIGLFVIGILFKLAIAAAFTTAFYFVMKAVGTFKEDERREKIFTACFVYAGMLAILLAGLLAVKTNYFLAAGG